jgi:hypothetical protein
LGVTRLEITTESDLNNNYFPSLRQADLGRAALWPNFRSAFSTSNWRFAIFKKPSDTSTSEAARHSLNLVGRSPKKFAYFTTLETRAMCSAFSACFWKNLDFVTVS